jgi:hypothetical protein
MAGRGARREAAAGADCARLWGDLSPVSPRSPESDPPFLMSNPSARWEVILYPPKAAPANGSGDAPRLGSGTLAVDLPRQ